MAIKKYGPTTPGRRGMTVTDYSVLSKVAPERSLLEPMKKHSGRSRCHLYRRKRQDYLSRSDRYDGGRSKRIRGGAEKWRHLSAIPECDTGTDRGVNLFCQNRKDNRRRCIFHGDKTA